MENEEKVRNMMKNQGKVMENDEKLRKIMKNQRKILENEEKVRKNEGKPMKNQGKVMENKEKVRKPCPRPKKNKISKTRKKNPQKIPHPFIILIHIISVLLGSATRLTRLLKYGISDTIFSPSVRTESYIRKEKKRRNERSEGY